MQIKIKEFFKSMAIIGLFLALFSTFCDWYIWSVYEGDLLKGNWSYSLFEGWHSFLNENNLLAKPKDLDFPLTLHVLLIMLIIIALYHIIFKDIDNTEDFEPLKLFALSNLMLLTLMGFYILLFPVHYLTVNQYYFPFAVKINQIDSYTYTYYYSIGFGYILMVFSFILIFPYLIHYYTILVKFEEEKNSFAYKRDRLIKANVEEIDFEKLIAEEELVIELQKKTLEE